MLTMNRRTALVSCCALLLLSLTGCPDGGPGCRTDNECSATSPFCVNAQCVECKENAHCGEGDGCKVCTESFTCVRLAECCHSDLDCPDGACRIAPGEDTGRCHRRCQVDGDCPEGQRCDGAFCVDRELLETTFERKVGDKCSGPGDCGLDLVCRDGVCAEPCQLEPIHFDYPEAKIRLDAKPALTQNAACIKERAQRVELQGHCDERGTEEYNLSLGAKRAKAVRDYLVTLGVPEHMLGTLSFGEEMPVCEEHTEACWWQNRRVEFVPKASAR